MLCHRPFQRSQVTRITSHTYYESHVLEGTECPSQLVEQISNPSCCYRDVLSDHLHAAMLVIIWIVVLATRLLAVLTSWIVGVVRPPYSRCA